jgi:hypothetical protein
VNERDIDHVANFMCGNRVNHVGCALDLRRPDPKDAVTFAYAGPLSGGTAHDVHDFRARGFRRVYRHA